MVHLFLKGISPTFEVPLQAACFGVPGPNVHGVVQPSNLGWKIEVNALPRLLGIPRVAILNDLESTAYGISALRQSDFAVLQAGSGSHAGNQCVIAPGTGLGEAGLFWDGKSYHPFATEGGHCDYAPRTKQDLGILTFLQARHEHVSWERLLSGNGIVTIWEFLTQVEFKPKPQWILDAMETTDPAAVISNAAKEAKCTTCVEAIKLFDRFLAIEAANMILKFKSTGGLFLAGGIAPKIITMLDPVTWKEIFESSGRMKHLLNTVSVYVMLNEKAPMLGSIYYAGLNM